MGKIPKGSGEFSASSKAMIPVIWISFGRKEELIQKVL